MSKASALGMTYIDQKRCFWPFGRLRYATASKSVPGSRTTHMGPIVVAEDPRIPNKTPRTAMLTGVFYLEAWRQISFSRFGRRRAAKTVRRTERHRREPLP